DGLLWQRCRWAEQEGGRLLGPSAPAVGLTGDKLMLGRTLAARGVPTPATVPAEKAGEVPRPYVTKPRFGARAQGIVRDGDEPGGGPRVAQPLVEGVAASVAFLVGPRERVALPPAAQHLSDDGRFTYLGGSVPLPAPLAERAERVARRAVECVPGLAG